MQLDSLGRADFNLIVDDPDFRIGGEQALRTLSVSAEIENEFIEAEPIHAFITGNRMDLNSFREDTVGLAILDILRDPPGEGSYTWLETGAKYNYNYTFNWDVKAGLEIGLGWGSNMTNNIGTYEGTPVGGVYSGTEVQVSKKFDINIPIVYNYKGNTAYAYSFQTNSRIATSSDNLFVGRDADLFVGVAQAIQYGQAKAVRVIDEDTYNLRKPAIDAGTLIVLAEGTKDDGTKFYLVIGSEVVVGSKIGESFVYTQQHIINTLIPNLVKERNSLLLQGEQLTIQQLANQTGQVLYWSHPDSPENIGFPPPASEPSENLVF
jgi:hypothetical protein